MRCPRSALVDEARAIADVTGLDFVPHASAGETVLRGDDRVAVLSGSLSLEAGFFQPQDIVPCVAAFQRLAVGQAP